MTLAVRVIPCLDVDQGRVVKGVNFVDLVDAGDPVELARKYSESGADELVFLDITASSSNRESTYDVVRRTADEIFIPLTVGGGIRTTTDIDMMLRCGADKVGINTAGLANPELISQGANRFGSQCIVLSVDVRRSPQHPSGFEATTHGGRQSSGRDALEWIVEATQRGAGEVLLNSMDADGTKAGFDIELIQSVRKCVNVPIIASGGAGELAHFTPAIQAGANAVLAASVFHFGTFTISDVKDELRSNGFPVR
ncbi:MAG: imidazole glycerol phosphate synthase subunit HisF [Actinobacteria bacterium]|uniref:imidazole glycerol-phosphate synthase n=1 Tax=freshwater metagenome TaxID=449393 RepID=A0A6J5YQ79_9ZZZZ|nr:imidazole glycerol phosphate synthase subunit HisF [Actinomycetota bacterium]